MFLGNDVKNTAQGGKQQYNDLYEYYKNAVGENYTRNGWRRCEKLHSKRVVKMLKLHSKRVEKMWKTTLETGGEDVKTTLETSV